MRSIIKPGLKHIFLSLSLLSFTTASIGITSPSFGPELATSKTQKQLVFGKKSMVVTNNPWATLAATAMLKEGGNATDAAIAAGFMLGLTEPQSSGIGGGGYVLSYNNKKLIAFDGREVAPHSASASWFLDKSGQPLSFDEAMLSPRSVGVPAEVALFYTMSKKQGKLPWTKLLTPAIELAENGFPLSLRLYTLLVADQNLLINNHAIKAVYFDETGKVKPVGSIIKNPEYAKSLKQIAKDPMSFYSGQIGKDIIKTINDQASQKLYNQKDLTNYKVLTYEPICSTYRNNYKICSVPPSSSGGTAVLELMKIYAANYSGTDYDDPQWVYNFLEASKLAFADRNQYIADPDFVKQPVKGLLDDDYIKARSSFVSGQALATPVIAGTPKDADKKYAPDLSPKPHGTTSVSIVDKDGNAIAMTVTVEHQFGSHLFVDGFFLNNELTDFSFIPATSGGKPIANRVEAGKRPRSSIAPSMVFNKSGQLQAITGSPGGSQIICYVAKNLILMLDMNKSPLDAVSAPNLCSTNNTPLLETGPSIIESMLPILALEGESLNRVDLVSGETNIYRGKDGWYGAADPRREGVAVGN
jgi:gamma-glutamyltranspeptidase/glutathione hydrolase